MYKILNCKLYKASPRKDKILAAMQNPNNKGLMVQLAKYLDDEYQTDEYLGGNPEADESLENPDESDSEIRESEYSGAGGGGGYSSDIEGLEDGMSLVDAPESESDLEELISEDGGEELAGEELSEEPAEAATATKGKKITACREVTVSELDSIKSTLNLTDTTQGVVRAAIKNNELWLYYDDDKNLNNIMEFVIEALPNMGMTWVEFNRLARSDNAIVFEILTQTVEEPEESKEAE